MDGIREFTSTRLMGQNLTAMGSKVQSLRGSFLLAGHVYERWLNLDSASTCGQQVAGSEVSFLMSACLYVQTFNGVLTCVRMFERIVWNCGCTCSVVELFDFVHCTCLFFAETKRASQFRVCVSAVEHGVASWFLQYSFCKCDVKYASLI